MDEGKKHFCYFCRQRFLAWSELDICCLGSAKCGLFLTSFIDKQQPKQSRNRGTGQNVSKYKIDPSRVTLEMLICP